MTLNSPDEHIKLQFMATKIGIPSAATLKAVSNDFPLVSHWVCISSTDPSTALPHIREEKRVMARLTLCLSSPGECPETYVAGSATAEGLTAGRYTASACDRESD